MTNSPRKYLRATTAATACVVAGIAVGAITDASASGSAGKTHRAKASAPAKTGGALRLKTLARRTVAGSFVVSTKQGFVTVTVARGTVKSVNGNQLTLAEGTRAATYQTVTLTLPDNTVVRVNHDASTLADVSDGQRAVVVETATRALVAAHTPATK